MNEHVDCTVRYSNGTHLTNTVRTMRASSTMSYEAAAQVLGPKIYGTGFSHVELVGPGADPASFVYRVHADPTIQAFAWESGLIGFGPEVGYGAKTFATGPDRALRAVVCVLARHREGKSDGVLLVPGMPEAAGQDAKRTALKTWADWAAESNDRPGRWGVRFELKD